MKLNRKGRWWRVSATLGAVAAFAVVLGASGRGDASPLPILALPKNPLPVCENEKWWSVGTAPSCAQGDPRVRVTMTMTSVGGCPVAKCTSWAPANSGPQTTTTRYACKSVAIANRCPGTPTIGTVTPLYYIAAIVYSPPGCTSTSAFKCGQTSTVEYQNASSNGTQTSTQSSFQAGVKVEATASIGNDVTGSLSMTASLGFQNTSTNGSSMTITKKQSQQIKASGNQDGINHDQDQFILLLNPLITFSVLEDDLKWAIGASAATAQYVVSVADLKNPALNPARMKPLQDLGFTTTDYQTILAQDPFAYGSTAIDPNRYVPTTWRNLPYETPDTGIDCNNGTCSCLSMTSAVSNDLTTAVSSSTQKQYTVGLSITAQSPKAWPVSVKATASTSMTWTNTAASQNTTGSTQSAAVTVQCPSPGYTGAQAMDIYWDTLYGSFMFVPHVFGGPQKMAPKLAMHVGQVTKANGAVAKRVRVDLTYGGTTYHTFTNKNGNYTFEGVPNGEGQLTVGGQRLKVTLGSAAKTTVKLSP